MADPRAVALQMARRYFASPRDRQIFMRQMQDEANFQDQTSPAGAQGFAQIMPATAQAWGVSNVHDPGQAFKAAASHMADYLHQYGGSWSKALTAYNAGPGAVGGHLPAETQAYISKILGGSDVHAGATAGASAGTPSLQTTTVPTFDQAGFQTAQKRFALGQLLAGQGQAKDNPLFAAGLVTTTAPSPQDFTGTKTTTQRVGQPSSPTAAPSGKGGVQNFDGTQVAAWIKPALEYARQQGWKGSVSSGYRSFAEQKRIYDSGVRPAAVPGTSNHEGSQFPRGAVDVTDAAQLASILRRSKYGRLLQWAGSKDPVHFSHPHNGAY